MVFTTQEFWNAFFQSGLFTQLLLFFALIGVIIYLMWRGDSPRRERTVKSQERIADAVVMFAEREKLHGERIGELTHEVRSGFQSLNLRFDTLPQKLQEELVPHIATELARRLVNGSVPQRRTFFDMMLGR